MNHRVREADKEDLLMSMRQGNPMRQNMGKTTMGGNFQTKNATMPMIPATADEHVKSSVGRTIEV